MLRGCVKAHAFLEVVGVPGARPRVRNRAGRVDRAGDVLGPRPGRRVPGRPTRTARRWPRPR